MRGIIGDTPGEGRPPCLPLGLFEGAPGQNLPDRARLVSPSSPVSGPGPRLIMPARKMESLSVS